MINISDVIVRIQRLLEDPNGQFYDVDKNIIPSLNTAIEWLVSIITPSLQSGKYNEQAFRDIMKMVVFQSSKFSRISVDPKEIGNAWAIISVFPKPSTIIRPANQLGELQYYSQIRKFINKTVENGPIITKIKTTDIPSPVPPGPTPASAGGNPTPYVIIPPEISLYRPEMAFIECANTCEFQGLEVVRDGWNRHRAGSRGNMRLFKRYAWTAPVGYSSLTIGGYSLAYTPEIEIFPAIGNAIVGLRIIMAPDMVASGYSATDTISIPELLRGALINKTIGIISGNEGDTTLYQISEKEVLQLIGSL